MQYTEKYNLWVKRVKDKKILNELSNMTEDQKSSAFFKDIEFGTAGMRGIVGAGSNCMNIYTVGRVTEAVAMYLVKNGGTKLAVSYDSRNMSKEFAKLVCRICAKYNITVYCADKMMPTPFLSFMVRYYGCDLGIMITASHNPKEYNGYKVYDNNGCQLLEEPSQAIMDLAESIDMFNVKTTCLKNAIKNGLVVYTGEDVKQSYFNCVKSVSLSKIENVKVVYTALNGTGTNSVPELLESRGAEVVLNKVQCKEDKNFTTCPYPNPEKKEVFATSEVLAEKVNADLIIATDPDADRVGIEVKDEDGYKAFTGNEVGALLTDYILSKGKKGYIVRSIVSTSLADKIAQNYGAEVKTVLTGFKYIGDFIKSLEDKKQEQKFLLGFEESYGYLAGSYVRDKDATVASMLICEMVSEYKKQGKTLIQKLNELYGKYGLFEHLVKSYRFEGKSGSERMQSILQALRQNPFNNIGTQKVIKSLDYKDGIDGFPKADVLVYFFDNGGSLVIRPSGTEPLIKAYITYSKDKQSNKIYFDETLEFLKKLFA